MAVARITSVAPSMPAVAEVSTAPKATAGARAAKKRKKTDAWGEGEGRDRLEKVFQILKNRPVDNKGGGAIGNERSRGRARGKELRASRHPWLHRRTKRVEGSLVAEPKVRGWARARDRVIAP
tara:strand:- start:320 stop:688 length:369 start_codon:yes stop_codon:yes gene_type:complete